jgi:transposase
MCLYVRSIGLAEGRKLQQIVRRDANRIKVRRAQVVLASAQGSKVPDIAGRLYFCDGHVRAIIKEFNACGLDALVPKYSGGRPPKFSEEQVSLMVEAALCPPDLLGWPFRRWSLSKLRDHLLKEKIVDSISLEKLRNLLKGRKVRLQRTKTWKECNDPRLRSKKN